MIDYNFESLIETVPARWKAEYRWKVTKGGDGWEAHPPGLWQFRPYTFSTFSQAIRFTHAEEQWGLLLIALIGNLRQRVAEHRAHQEWATQGTYVEAEHVDQDLYTIVLQHGHTVVGAIDGECHYPNTTAIINADHSLTVARDGEIIAWHDTDTYWRAYTQ